MAPAKEAQMSIPLMIFFILKVNIDFGKIWSDMLNK